ncbi:hypothetical protein [Janthinobacterium sp.]|uniref:hypothetical protein n=1 Tax=Janthinobacterium sp. TaxID=1871054 RepID=UPI00293D5EF7|nr:hypothetical protein [Janthinobacterium sp.]
MDEDDKRRTAGPPGDGANSGAPPRQAAPGAEGCSGQHDKGAACQAPAMPPLEQLPAQRDALRARAKADKLHMKIALGVCLGSFAGLCAYTSLIDHADEDGLVPAIPTLALISLFIGAVVLAAIKTSVKIAARWR